MTVCCQDFYKLTSLIWVHTVCFRNFENSTADNKEDKYLVFWIGHWFETQNYMHFCPDDYILIKANSVDHDEKGHSVVSHLGC